jgi:hypothetical protein
MYLATLKQREPPPLHQRLQTLTAQKSFPPIREDH